MNDAVFVIHDGLIQAVAGGPLSLAEVGTRETQRLSKIEFNDSTDRWDVSDAASGAVLFSNQDYDVALSWEIDYYNHKLSEVL